MPIYNTAEYIQRSIGSILQQSFADFELICVDDASTDDSLAVLQELKRQDSRIIIISHEVNCGAAISRNDGLEAAKGEYVIFLDSDDYFYPDMLETTYQRAVENDADMVIFGSEQIVGNMQEPKIIGYPFQIIDSDEKKAIFLPTIRHVPWDKLVRKKIVSDNSIRFQNTVTNNDIFYSFSVTLMAEKIVTCDKILLGYCDGRKGSLTSVRFSKKNCTVEAFYAIYCFSRQKDIAQCIKTVLMNMLADNIQGYLSDSAYPLVMRQESLNILLGYQDLVSELELYMRDGLLYPHNCKFVSRFLVGEDICQIKYSDYYSESLRDMISENKIMHKKIALWGCGKNGKRLLDLIQTHNLAIDYVVDESKELQGKSFGQYIIQPYDDVSEDIDIIWITNPAFKDAIEERAVGKEVIYVWQ